MNIIEIPVDDLIPYENNPRLNDEAVDAVAASIREFGFKQPVVVDKDNVIVCGHTRMKAAVLLGLDTVPAIRADDLTEEQIKAYRLADNKTAELADWDFDALSKELQGLSIDMADFGFAEESKIDEEISTLQAESNFNYKEQYGVIVMCKDEEEQEKIYNELTEAGYECKVVAT